MTTERKRKSLISKRGTAFDVLLTLAEDGAMEYHVLRQKHKFVIAAEPYGKSHHSLLNETLHRLEVRALIQTFYRRLSHRLSDRCIAITPAGLDALEEAEARPAHGKTALKRDQYALKTHDASSAAN